VAIAKKDIIVVVRSKVNGKYNYCPLHHVPLLRPEMDDKAIFDTPDEAKEDGKRKWGFTDDQFRVVEP
jgi:hypothetical protein